MAYKTIYKTMLLGDYHEKITIIYSSSWSSWS